MIGELSGKGYVDLQRKGKRVFLTDKVPETSDGRFLSIETLPKIASKYRNVNQGFSIGTMSKREPDFFVQ